MAVTNYLWDEDHYLEEYDENGVVKTSYTNSPNRFGDVISHHRGSATGYYHYDVQGSTRQVTNESENVTDTFLFDAWGDEIEKVGITEIPFRFIGKLGYYHDSEIGSYYVRARNYQPSTTRWFSVDPIWPNDGLNKYRYVKNSPIRFVDPSGLAINKCECNTTHVTHGTAGGVIVASTTIYTTDDCKDACCPNGSDFNCSSRKLPPDKPGTPQELLGAMCDSILLCPNCDIRECQSHLAELQTAKFIADQGSFGISGWLEEKGYGVGGLGDVGKVMTDMLGAEGGRCHLWTSYFLKCTDTCPWHVKSCLDVKNEQITLDGNPNWGEDHSINVIRNKCTGGCLIADDAFWAVGGGGFGGEGAVYNPCDVENKNNRLGIGKKGKKEWDSVKKKCGC